MKRHEFCRFELKQVRKEYQYFKKISGLGDYYLIDGKTMEIHGVCCRYSGKVKAITEREEENEKRKTGRNN